MNSGACAGGALISTIFLVFGCGASVNASAEGDATASGEGQKARAQAEASGEGVGQGEMSRAQLAPSRNAAAQVVSASNAPASVPAGAVLLGARHDLRLRPGQVTASCECLVVGLGGSHNSAMLWSAAPPDIDETTQLSIALSSEGRACKGEPKKSLGASYWGYRLSGNDVVVLVEAGKKGRPITTGAIIPKPVGSGQVYVAPAFKKLPYGRALEGNGLCKVGNPGRPRTEPFTELELGADAPGKDGDGRASIRAPRAPMDDSPTTIELPAD